MNLFVMALHGSARITDAYVNPDHREALQDTNSVIVFADAMLHAWAYVTHLPLARLSILSNMPCSLLC